MEKEHAYQSTSVHVSLYNICRYRAIYDVIDMPWDWPVDTNYHEAKAFCTWKGEGYRVPTEAEHHRMRGDPVRRERGGGEKREGRR